MGLRPILTRSALFVLAVLVSGCEPPLEVRGWLLIRGKRVDIATKPLTTTGERCREPERREMRLRVMIPIPPEPPALRDSLSMSFTATLGLTSVGVETDAEAVRATFPRADGGGRYTEPKAGWVRYRALSTMGPIDVEFDVDFGEYGHIKGRARAERIEELPCIPHPYVPPPVP